MKRQALMMAAAASLMAPYVLAQPARPSAQQTIALREETLARTIGTLAYVYGYPAID